MKRTAPVLMAICTLAAAARPAAAWEAKGHMIINRLAAEAMPADTPAFFKNAAARLEYLGPEPDRWRVGAGPQLGAVNGPDHFIDMEPVLGLELPADRYKYIAMVDKSDIPAKYHLTAERIGFLPYRIAELTQTLQSEWRDYNKAVESSRTTDRDSLPQIEQDIIYTAGILGHYVADGSNPHHTTVHYNGWNTEFAPNPNGYTTIAQERESGNGGFHARFEGDFVNAAIQAGDVKPYMTAVAPVKDILPDTISYLKTTNGTVTKLYDLEKAGDFATTGAINPEGKRFAAQRMAAGASMLRDVWAYAMKGVPRRPRNGNGVNGGNSSAIGENSGKEGAPKTDAGS